MNHALRRWYVGLRLWYKLPIPYVFIMLYTITCIIVWFSRRCYWTYSRFRNSRRGGSVRCCRCTNGVAHSSSRDGWSTTHANPAECLENTAIINVSSTGIGLIHLAKNTGNCMYLKTHSWYIYCALCLTDYVINIHDLSIRYRYSLAIIARTFPLK